MLKRWFLAARQHVPGAGMVGSALELLGLGLICVAAFRFGLIPGLIAAGIALFVTGLFVG